MSFLLQTEFPVYGAGFQDDYHIILAGGGGEGNNGVPNKISRAKIAGSSSQPTVSIIDELEYKGDSSTGLVVNEEGVIIVGINETSENIKSGLNKHLRKFEVNNEKDQKLEFVGSVDIEKSADTNIYQKSISSSTDGSVIATVSTREEPSIVRVINGETLELIQSIESESKEIKDVSINPSGNKVSYITEREIHVIDLKTGEKFLYNKSPKNYSFAKVKFINEDEIFVAVNLTMIKGVLLLQVAIGENTIIFRKAKVISNKYSKITGLDIYNNELIAIATSDNSILFIATSDFYLLKTLKNVHKFAITKIQFSPNGKYLLSTSAAASVRIDVISKSITNRLTWLYNTLIVAFIAVLIYGVKSQITEEHLEVFDDWVHYLFDEPELEYYSAIDDSITLSGSDIEARDDGFENTEVVGTYESEAISSTTSTHSESEPAYSTEIHEGTETIIEVTSELVIKEGDIVVETTHSSAYTESIDVKSAASSLV
ncbi:hypothetical protein WICMUC_005462 [Wickerhamomyces mucosus]|uniref:Guanine nucleotide-exchange factor SEC12 n=1 Tax=Wickerhamomyces mucosus TaxID=1378264 RepID=A0A9P8T6I1_9ASCO|nr:hypothetical protein WICMUC_005462 [Wickerhamomyces mucosus]